MTMRTARQNTTMASTWRQGQVSNPHFDRHKKWVQAKRLQRRAEAAYQERRTCRIRR